MAKYAVGQRVKYHHAMLDKTFDAEVVSVKSNRVVIRLVNIPGNVTATRALTYNQAAKTLS